MTAFRICILKVVFVIAIAAVAQIGSASPSIPLFHSAAAARAWAESEQARGDYQLAGEAYLAEARLRAGEGDPQAAEVELRKADRLITSLALAVSVPAEPPPYRLAKLEPANGCYFGVLDEYPGGRRGNADDLERRIGRTVGVAFIYQTYGDPFPWDWARRQARAGRLIQIAWEPQAGLDEVRDDDYLNGWADAASQCGTGIFLRFAGEMNGDWTAWGKNPTAYRRAFRLVHDVVDRHCANVAMVWAPNDVPTAGVEEYYPGDDAVDWVGISLYLVRYYDNDLSRPAWQDHPITFIDPFYERYAARKPLCLVECGISRRGRVENLDVDSYAAARISDLLNGIRVRYPRLKMFCWFDRNNLTGAQPGRQLNDYSLPEGSLALAAFRDGTADPYFLGRSNDEAPAAYKAITAGFPVSYSGPVLASLSTYIPNANLDIARGTASLTVPRPYRFFLPRGAGPVTVRVEDARGDTAESARFAAP